MQVYTDSRTILLNDTVVEYLVDFALRVWFRASPLLRALRFAQPAVTLAMETSIHERRQLMQFELSYVIEAHGIVVDPHELYVSEGAARRLIMMSDLPGTAAYKLDAALVSALPTMFNGDPYREAWRDERRPLNESLLDAYTSQIAERNLTITSMWQYLMHHDQEEAALRLITALRQRSET